MTGTVHPDCGDDERLITITDSAGFKIAQDWLTGILRPINSGSTGESCVDLRILRPAHSQLYHADADDVATLSWLFKTVGFSARHIVVKHDTIDFNIHHPEGTLAPSEWDACLPLYSIADNEFGVCWTWDPTSYRTRAILWYFTNDGLRQTDFVVSHLSRLDRSCNHVMTPALFVLQSENAAMRGWVDLEAVAISTCQLKTGHHVYRIAPTRAEEGTICLKDLSSSLEPMTRRMSGLAVNITTSVLCLQRMVQLADFMLNAITDSISGPEMAGASVPDELQKSIRSASLIMEQIKSEKRYAEGLLSEAEAWKHKSTIVVQTLLSLTTQQDAKVSIDIADASRNLAAKATRDSNSMKAIAAVTMCFLPGTFVSSLFAMPMFNLESDATWHVSRQFWVYWALSLPLTFVVIAAWLFWTHRRNIVEQMATERTKSSLS